MATEGCWVQVWEHKNFTGRSVRFDGPTEDPKLGDDSWSGGGEIGDDIDSLVTGPRAWFEGFEDENFSDSVIRVPPDTRMADLDVQDIGDNIDSYRLYDSKPPHW